jgi:hypothetical protein
VKLTKEESEEILAERDREWAKRYSAERSRNNWRGFAIFLIIVVIGTMVYFNHNWYSPTDVEILEDEIWSESFEIVEDAIGWSFPDGYLRGYLSGLHAGAAFSLGYIDGWMDGYRDTDTNYQEGYARDPEGVGYDEAYEKGKDAGAEYFVQYLIAKAKESIG